MDFKEFPKLSRLSKDMIITEKIDGTNAQVVITMPTAFIPADSVLATHPDTHLVMLAGSRSRYITPEADNFGFARWVKEHATELFELGEGQHFGEWWGKGVQRGYGLSEKRFSLFNASRWAETRPACCHVVPILKQYTFSTTVVEETLAELAVIGSAAAPGFMQPEGVVVFHTASYTMFKKTFDGDGHKGQR